MKQTGAQKDVKKEGKANLKPKGNKKYLDFGVGRGKSGIEVWLEQIIHGRCRKKWQIKCSRFCTAQNSKQ